MAGAEDTAVGPMSLVADAMAGAPAPMVGVESALAGAPATEPYDWEALAARSAWETAQADSAGALSSYLLGAIGLVMLAEVVVHLFATGRPAPSIRSGQRQARSNSSGP